MSDLLITEGRQFEADHYHSLPGFCEPRHGHVWEIEATVKDSDSTGLGRALNDWTAGVNCSLLNEQEALRGRNPTAETLAEWAFTYLEAAGLCPIRIKIREKSQYWAACLGRPAI